MTNNREEKDKGYNIIWYIDTWVRLKVFNGYKNNLNKTVLILSSLSNEFNITIINNLISYIYIWSLVKLALIIYNNHMSRYVDLTS